MKYIPYIEFTKSLLNELKISTHIIEKPEIRITNTIDLGLRTLMFGNIDYLDLLQNSMNQAKDNIIYRFYDEHYCHYLFMKIPDINHYYFIGPYLLSIPSLNDINQHLEALDLPKSLNDQLMKYYMNLPYIEDENLLLSIANTLGVYLWNSKENFEIEYVDYAIPDRIKPIIQDSDIHKESDLYIDILEENYANERKLMEAVSSGKLNLLSTISSNVFNKGTEQRISDSIRNRKNYLIILNTLLRKAVENGDVHPLHIHKLSSEYALKIEKINSISDSNHLMSDMIRNYCLLVKNHSLKQYSYLVGKVITLISYDLSVDLSLKAISSKLNVNPSYLSNTFKKECNCTLTEYVNKKRVEYAVSELHNTDKQISTIAYECGISDTNYFIKLFKKHTGITPSNYRKQFKKSI